MGVAGGTSGRFALGQRSSSYKQAYQRGGGNSLYKSPGFIGVEPVQLTREGSYWWELEHNHKCEPVGKVFNRGLMWWYLHFRKFHLRRGWKNGCVRSRLEVERSVRNIPR